MAAKKIARSGAGNDENGEGRASPLLVMPRLDRGILFGGGKEDCPLGGGQ
jgi:hypothetical protein